MQDRLGGDTRQCAVGNSDRLTNGWMDGSSGNDTNSLGKESVIHDYHYEQRTANNCQQLLSLGQDKGRTFYSNNKFAINLY